MSLYWLQPGRPMSLYHHEARPEDFLVLAGECPLLIEGEEHPLQAWDFVHCPPGTAHTIVAGERPALVFAVGARKEKGAPLPVDPVAIAHGAGVPDGSTEAQAVYASFGDPMPVRGRMSSAAHRRTTRRNDRAPAACRAIIAFPARRARALGARRPGPPGTWLNAPSSRRYGPDVVASTVRRTRAASSCSSSPGRAPRRVTARGWAQRHVGMLLNDERQRTSERSRRRQANGRRSGWTSPRSCRRANGRRHRKSSGVKEKELTRRSDELAAAGGCHG